MDKDIAQEMQRLLYVISSQYITRYLSMDYIQGAIRSHL